jgi:predicted phage baseplate assembly protein
VWEAFNGATWTRCDIESDGTGGLNKPGDVVLHLPPSHTAAVTAGERAGWIRCRAVPPLGDLPFYSASPIVRAAEAFVVGATVEAVHAETIRDEILGLSEGVPGQRFTVTHAPVVSGGPPVVLEVAAGHGWETWNMVDSFARTGPDDRVFRLDGSAGEVELGPAVRAADGSLEQFGAIPPKGAPLRIPSYRHGGGPEGNVARKAIKVMRTTVPLVERVDNRRTAFGGVAGETVEEAKIRGPIALRTRDRAVTTEDYEQLTRQAAPDIARVRCVAAGPGGSAGSVRVLLVPACPVDESGRLRFEELQPPDDVLTRVTRHLDERRVAGTRLLVSPPFYQGVTVMAHITARLHAPLDALESAALNALHRYVNPLVGGPDGAGWPFGRSVQAGEIFSVLQNLPGTDMVEEVLLFAGDPLTGELGDPVQRIDLDQHSMVFSFGHQVNVTKGR